MEMRVSLVLIFVLILLSVSAQATVIDEAQVVADEIQSYLSTSETTLLVKGNHASNAEKLLLAYLQDNYPNIDAVPVIGESQVLSLTSDTIILLGGPYQNSYSSE